MATTLPPASGEQGHCVFLWCETTREGIAVCGVVVCWVGQDLSCSACPALQHLHTRLATLQASKLTVLPASNPHALQHLRPRQRQVVPPVPPEDAGPAHQLLTLQVGPGEWRLCPMLRPSLSAVALSRPRCSASASSPWAPTHQMACPEPLACPGPLTPSLPAGPAVWRLPVRSVRRARGRGAGQAGWVHPWLACCLFGRQRTVAPHQLGQRCGDACQAGWMMLPGGLCSLTCALLWLSQPAQPQAG